MIWSANSLEAVHNVNLPEIGVEYKWQFKYDKANKAIDHMYFHYLGLSQG